MSVLEKLAADSMTAGLQLALNASPVDAKTIAMALEISGAAQIDLGQKLRDGKITEEEVRDSLEKVGALGNNSAFLAAKSAVGRIIEQIL